MFVEMERKERKRLPSSVSFGLLLANNDGRLGFGKELVLVRKKETGLWGLPAGGLEPGDFGSREAIGRELREETNLTYQEVVVLFHSGPVVIISHSPSHASVGLIYEGYMRLPLPKEGYQPKSEETDLVKPFSISELLSLIVQPQKIYRPDLNLRMITEFISNYIRMKYGVWEGLEFALAVAGSWGLDLSLLSE